MYFTQGWAADLNRKEKTILAHSGLALFAVLLAALVGEVALRLVVAPPIKWKFPQESYVYDEEVNYLLRPGDQAFTHDKPVSINSAGIRDREYPPVPPSGTVRVIGLGDSQTFGNGLDIADTWPKQLERELLESGGSWEVLNCGVPATDTWQHSILFDRLNEMYHPDWLVLAFYVNDPAPSYRLPPTGSGEVTNSTSKRAAYLMKRSALISYLHHSAKALRGAMRPSSGSLRELHRLTGEEDATVEKGWRQAEASLEEIREKCARAGIRFITFALPRRDQVDGTIEGRAYNERIADICRRHSISLVDMLPLLQEAYNSSGRQLFIPWDGHNSALANAEIARRLAVDISSQN